jgi:hypothetical protein
MIEPFSGFREKAADRRLDFRQLPPGANDDDGSVSHDHRLAAVHLVDDVVLALVVGRIDPAGHMRVVVAVRFERFANLVLAALHQSLDLCG